MVIQSNAFPHIITSAFESIESMQDAINLLYIIQLNCNELICITCVRWSNLKLIVQFCEKQFIKVVCMQRIRQKSKKKIIIRKGNIREGRRNNDNLHGR